MLRPTHSRILRRITWAVAPATVLAITLASCAPAGDATLVAPTDTPEAAIPTPDPQVVAAGESLYQTYCAACHGVDLEGEANWRLPKEDGSLPAPPHDSSGHTWHHPDALLLEIITQGGNPASGGSMPRFGQTLTQEQMGSILAFIKTYWESDQRDIQWQISNP